MTVFFGVDGAVGFSKSAHMFWVQMSFFGLSGVATLLMLHVQAHAVQYRLLYAVPILVVFGAMLFSIVREGGQLVRGRISRALPSLGPTLAAVVAGSFATVYLARPVGLGVVLASALVGTGAAIIAPKWAVAAYCGSFVGMLSPESYPALYQLVVATLAAALLFWAGSPVFGGYGGKLGTSAFFGCIVAAWLTGAPLQDASLPTRQLALLILLVSALSAASAYVLSIRCKQGPVLGSSLVGLFAGFVLPWLPAEMQGNVLAVVAFCASFAGMASRERLPTESHALLAGLLAGGIFVFASPSLGGAGGKLGTIAFVATLAARPLGDLLSLLLTPHVKMVRAFAVAFARSPD